MPITNSVINSQVVQVDGRISVVEVHTDQVGLTYDVLYFAAANDNLTTNLNNHAVQLNAQLPVNEEAVNLANVLANGASAVVTTNYSTLSQNINNVLAAYTVAASYGSINYSLWLGTLTFAQLAAANPSKFPNATAFTNWRNQFVVPGQNANTTNIALVGG